jgi:hypothetical protein
MKNRVTKLLALLALFINVHAQAEPTVTSSALPKMLMYIQPIEYTSPISLWSPYQNYWFYQGPMLEAQAMDKLSQAYGDVAVCEGNQSAKTLVWLQPRMFYNPQVQVFYGEIVANVYTGIGKLLSSYKGESKVRGLLNLQADDKIAKTYAVALDEIMVKMQADSALQTILSAEATSLSTTDSAPCSMVTLLPVPKIRVISF